MRPDSPALITPTGLTVPRQQRHQGDNDIMWTTAEAEYIVQHHAEYSETTVAQAWAVLEAAGAIR